MTISLNPMAVSNAYGFFSTDTDGFIQGEYQFDPVARQYIAGGYLASTVVQPVWGGMAISENIPITGVAQAIGGSIVLASSVANLTGFTVSTQMSNAIIVPGAAPSVAAPQSVQFARLGSGVRLAVKCDPSLISLDGGLINQQVSWDFNNQQLVPYSAGTPTVAVTSMTPTFASGVYTIAVVAAAATTVGAVGDAVNISGATNSGTGGNSIVNGNFVVTAFTDNQHFSIQVTAASGAIGTITTTSAVINQGVGALPVKILAVQNGNSKVINYTPGASPSVTWNNSGVAALILL